MGLQIFGIEDCFVLSKRPWELIFISWYENEINFPIIKVNQWLLKQIKRKKLKSPAVWELQN